MLSLRETANPASSIDSFRGNQRYILDYLVAEVIEPDSAECDLNSADVFDNHRRMLFSIAYRMLGTVTDAEDMVQETFLR